MIPVGRPAKEEMVVKNLEPGKEYNFRIKAVNSEGESEPLEAEKSVTLLGKPGKPEGPLDIYDVHENGCTLEWSPPKEDGGLPIQNYIIEKKDTLTGRWVPAGKTFGDETKAKVTGLEPGKRYEFRVKAVNDAGESEPLEGDRSIIAKNPFEEPGPPGMPEIKDYDKDFVELEWEPPIRDGGAPITGYIIEKRTRGSPDFVQAVEVRGNVCHGKVPRLKEGEKYEFRVRAVNKAGPSAPSEATKPHTAKARFLKPHIDRTNLLSLTVRVGQMVSFDVDVTGEPPPKINWIFKGRELFTGNTYLIDNVDYNTKFNLSRATRHESGVYTITAMNSAGADEAQVEITVLSKPSQPNGPLEVFDIYDEGCKLKWKPPDDDGGTPIEYYEIEKLDEETGRWVPCGKTLDTKCEVANLIPGHKYKFRVKAVNKEGESDELETHHSIVAKNPFDEPGKPGKPEITDWDKDHVDLKWAPPETDGGAPITGYIIEKRKKGTHKWQPAKTTSTPITQATVPDLEEGEEYEFRVLAVNKAGPSEPSDPSRSIIAKPRKLAPKIDRTNLKNIKVRKGQPFKIEVDVKGEPEPTIEWKNKDGEKLVGHTRLNIDIEPYHTTMILSQSERGDSGIYTITAKNEHGTDEASLQLTIVSKPSKPKGPLEVSNIHAEGCKLNWDKPEDDGGEPIQHYLVEKFDAEVGRWVPALTTKNLDTEVTGLIPGHEYKFRVKAVNAEGESEPLETDHSFIAKNPFDEPGKPGKPMARDWDKHSVDLVWKPPDNDGGTPIKKYIIEMKDKFSKKWEKAAETIDAECSWKVPGLVEGMDYQFRVRGVNKAGTGVPSDPSDTVTAKSRHVAPKIDKIKNVTLHVGQNLKLDVKVIGETPPKTLWFLGDVQLKTDGHHLIENTPNRTKLIINGVTRKNTGTYMLTAENPTGKDDETVNVTVLDRPSPPEGPVDVSEVQADGCKLKWKKPLDDGGEPIIYYLVERQDPETGR